MALSSKNFELTELISSNCDFTADYKPHSSEHVVYLRFQTSHVKATVLLTNPRYIAFYAILLLFLVQTSRPFTYMVLKDLKRDNTCQQNAIKTKQGYQNHRSTIQDLRFTLHYLTNLYYRFSTVNVVLM